MKGKQHGVTSACQPPAGCRSPSAAKEGRWHREHEGPTRGPLPRRTQCPTADHSHWQSQRAGWDPAEGSLPGYSGAARRPPPFSTGCLGPLCPGPLLTAGSASGLPACSVASAPVVSQPPRLSSFPAVFIYSAFRVPSQPICLILLGINCKQTLVLGSFLVISCKLPHCFAGQVLMIWNRSKLSGF